MANDLYSIPLQRIDGETTSLSPFRGRVLLVVNVASQCGLTRQYEELEKLYARYRESGFEILAFPSNDFAGQEPGSNDEIATFCKTTFGVNFPLFTKISVTGPHKHPLYRALVAAKPISAGTGKLNFIEGLVKYGIMPNKEPELLWNFEKFLVARDGQIVARFSPDTLPEDPLIAKAIETELAKR